MAGLDLDGDQDRQAARVLGVAEVIGLRLQVG
jgi:hypothetical protein